MEVWVDIMAGNTDMIGKISINGFVLKQRGLFLAGCCKEGKTVDVAAVLH